MFNPQTLSRFVERKELATTLGLSLPTIDRMQAAGRIGPRAIRVSAGRVGWLRVSIESWIGAAEKLGRLPNQREWAEMTASNATAK